MPRRPRFSLMVSPPIRISPASGTSSMLMQRSMVDLPEPDAPRIEMTSPSFAVSDTPLRTSSVPKLLRRLLMETASFWDDKDGTPSDMGGLQSRLHGRRVAQMGREPPFDGYDDARDDEVDDQVDQACHDEDLDGPEGLRNQFGRDAGNLHHGDDRGKRRGLDHQDQLAAVGRECLPDRDREDDAAEEQEPRHTAGAGGLHLLMRYGLQAAADDLAGISRRVQRQGQDGAPIGFAEEGPEAPCLQGRAELSQTVIDQKDLNQQRRAS